MPSTNLVKEFPHKIFVRAKGIYRLYQYSTFIFYCKPFGTFYAVFPGLHGNEDCGRIKQEVSSWKNKDAAGCLPGWR